MNDPTLGNRKISFLRAIFIGVLGWVISWLVNLWLCN